MWNKEEWRTSKQKLFIHFKWLDSGKWYIKLSIDFISLLDIITVQIDLHDEKQREDDTIDQQIIMDIHDYEIIYYLLA